MQELASNGVEIYRFPVDDETVAEMNAGMNVSPLRAVLACEQSFSRSRIRGMNAKRVRGIS